MTILPTTRSNVLGTTLLAAAMALPALEFASAETAPERSMISFKYLNYKDWNSSVPSSPSAAVSSAVNNNENENENENEHEHVIRAVVAAPSNIMAAAITGASPTPSPSPVVNGGTSSGSQDRITINSYTVMSVIPIAGEWGLSTTLTSDSVSGASPWYHTSALTPMNDLRRSADLQLTRYYSLGTWSVGGSFSSESDYISRSISLQGSRSADDKNTTWNAGFGYTSDTINPNNKVVADEKKQVINGVVGVTRVMSKNDIVQLNFGYSHGTGYYTDPYKTPYDNRPRERNNTTMLVRWNHYVDDLQGTLHLSYRYYTDTFGIRAHTMGAEYVQPLQNGWTLTPLLRMYSQNEADFYLSTSAANPALPTPKPVYYTEDQRMSAFGALTMGVKVSKQLNEDWNVDLKYEKYEQRSDWALTGTPDKYLADFSARSIQVGLSYLF